MCNLWCFEGPCSGLALVIVTPGASRPGPLPRPAWTCSPSSTSFFGSGTRFWFGVRLSTKREQSLFSAVGSSNGWSETPFQVRGSDTGCTSDVPVFVLKYQEKEQLVQAFFSLRGKKYSRKNGKNSSKFLAKNSRISSKNSSNSKNSGFLVNECQKVAHF